MLFEPIFHSFAFKIIRFKLFASIFQNASIVPLRSVPTSTLETVRHLFPDALSTLLASLARIPALPPPKSHTMFFCKMKVTVRKRTLTEPERQPGSSRPAHGGPRPKRATPTEKQRKTRAATHPSKETHLNSQTLTISTLWCPVHQIWCHSSAFQSKPPPSQDPPVRMLHNGGQRRQKECGRRRRNSKTTLDET